MSSSAINPAIITRHTSDDCVWIWFLDEYYLPISYPIPISVGFYDEKLNDNNFSLAIVTLEPNKYFDGILNTYDDFYKFDFNICDLVYYMLGTTDNKIAVRDAMNNCTFWDTVNKIINNNNVFNDENIKKKLKLVAPIA